MQHKGLVIGFDFGYRRIGMAIGHCETMHTRPLSTVLATQGQPDWKQVTNVINQWKPEAFIVGLPTKIDGSSQYTTDAAEQFAQALKSRYHLPVYLVDERLTTVEARALLFEQGGYKKLSSAEVDSFAACVILEQWLRTAGPHDN